jgi:YVTN family beta-propeller protein
MALALSAVLPGQAKRTKSLLVLSKADKTLSIVDPTTLKVIAKMPSGPDPHEVVASADGHYAYISNYGFGAYNTITTVDLVEHRTLSAADLGPLRGPHGLAFSGGKVYFTAESAKAIGRYDPASGKVDWVLGTGQNRTHMLVVSSDEQHIVTSNVSSATMTIIERVAARGPVGPQPGPASGAASGAMQGDWEETVVAVGRGAEGFDVSPDGREIWCANAADGTISIIDKQAKHVMRTLEAKVSGANRLKFTPDGSRVFVTTLRGPEVVVLDVPSRSEVKRIKVGSGAAGIQMEPDGSRAYIACTPDDYVVVIDLSTLTETSRIDAGKQPDGMAWAEHP